jgi:hypothetical protein
MLPRTSAKMRAPGRLDASFADVYRWKKPYREIRALSNRRSFLRLAGLGPAGAAAALLGARPAEASASPSAEVLRRSSFAGCIGEEFEFERGAFALTRLELAAIEPLGCGTAERVMHEDAFSLRFVSPNGEAVEQDTYRVNHPRLGRFVLFVSPCDPEGRVVEAVFNRV